jgi:hypothetical protein
MGRWKNSRYMREINFALISCKIIRYINVLVKKIHFSAVYVNRYFMKISSNPIDLLLAILSP